MCARVWASPQLRRINASAASGRSSIMTRGTLFMLNGLSEFLQGKNGVFVCALSGSESVLVVISGIIECDKLAGSLASVRVLLGRSI